MYECLISQDPLQKSITAPGYPPGHAAWDALHTYMTFTLQESELRIL